MRMPLPDPRILARRHDIAGLLRTILPADCVIADAESAREGLRLIQDREVFGKVVVTP